MNTTHRNRILASLVAVGAALALVAHARETSSEDPPLPVSQEISLRLRGVQAKQLNMVFALPADGYPGEVKLRPLDCTPPSGALNPSNVAVDFWITHAPLTVGGATKLCVFSVMIGEAGVASGFIVPAKDVPEVEDKEPVYQVESGYAIVGGTWPAARGKRGRAGAPGTQFVVEIDGDTERYYLLNDVPGHSVTVRVDGQPDTILDSNNDYVEVSPIPGTAGSKAAKSPITTMTPERLTFRNNAAAAALRCGLPGRDSVYMAALALRLKEEKKPGNPGDPVVKPGDTPGGK